MASPLSTRNYSVRLPDSHWNVTTYRPLFFSFLSPTTCREYRKSSPVFFFLDPARFGTTGLFSPNEQLRRTPFFFSPPFLLPSFFPAWSGLQALSCLPLEIHQLATNGRPLEPPPLPSVVFFFFPLLFFFFESRWISPPPFFLQRLQRQSGKRFRFPPFLSRLLVYDESCVLFPLPLPPFVRNGATPSFLSKSRRHGAGRNSMASPLV